MQVHIIGHGFTMTDVIRDHAARRVRFALGRFSGRVTHVRVVLGDENRPTGGLDKTCHVTVRLKDLPEFFAGQIDSDISVAIDRAVDRIDRTVARRLDPAFRVE